MIFPTAIIDEHARVGKGCIIRHQAVISAQVELGRNCMVADNAYVGHDSVIGAYTYISPGVNVNGSVTIGEGCFVGTGAVILPDRRVGAGCTVGAAACVVADVPDGQTVVGVPARAAGADARRDRIPRTKGCPHRAHRNAPSQSTHGRPQGPQVRGRQSCRGGSGSCIADGDRVTRPTAVRKVPARAYCWSRITGSPCSRSVSPLSWSTRST